MVTPDLSYVGILADNVERVDIDHVQLLYYQRQKSPWRSDMKLMLLELLLCTGVTPDLSYVGILADNVKRVDVDHVLLLYFQRRKSPWRSDMELMLLELLLYTGVTPDLSYVGILADNVKRVDVDHVLLLYY
jgi:hypothetical protein